MRRAAKGGEGRRRAAKGVGGGTEVEGGVEGEDTRRVKIDSNDESIWNLADLS
jgi:hypothetical protein